MDVIPTELAKYGNTGIAIATLIFAGWMFNKFMQATKEHREFSAKTLERIEKLQNSTVQKLSQAVNRNTKVTEKSITATTQLIAMQNENIEFMKGLNGKLTKAVVDTAKEKQAVGAANAKSNV